MTAIYMTRERGADRAKGRLCAILTGTKAHTFTHEHPLVKLQEQQREGGGVGLGWGAGSAVRLQL
jgi:hypothetical protein